MSINLMHNIIIWTENKKMTKCYCPLISRDKKITDISQIKTLICGIKNNLTTVIELI